MVAPQQPPKVLALLASVDDHLQAMQHYGHSRDLREAMGTVQNLLDALQGAMNAFGGECFDWGPARAALDTATTGSPS